MLDRQEHHVAAGWDADNFRWIEAGPLRLDEDDKGAIAKVQGVKVCWLSATELAGLTRHLAAWFTEDPSSTLRHIEALASRVKGALEEWNDRARIDEEHPPYADLTLSLDALLGQCRLLHEALDKFADRAEAEAGK